MNSLEIEEPPQSSTDTNSTDPQETKPSTRPRRRSSLLTTRDDSNDSHAKSMVILISLPFIAIGYNLSIFNSLGIYLWEPNHESVGLYSFRNACDTLMALMAFATCLFYSYQKIPTQYCRLHLILADVAMILGCFFSFGSSFQAYYFIYFGRMLVGISIGINFTVAIPYIRYFHNMLSSSEYKIEKRRFIIDGLIALGIFLGMIPANIFSELVPYRDVDLEHPETITLEEGDFTTLYILTAVPSLFCIWRIIILKTQGFSSNSTYSLAQSTEDKQPSDNDDSTYNPIFTNESDLSNTWFEQFKQTFKFRGRKDFWAVFEHPVKERVELSYMLYFMQVCSGFVIAIINSSYTAKFFQQIDPENPDAQDIQFEGVELSFFYLVMILIVGNGLTKQKVSRRFIISFGAAFALLFSAILTILAFLDMLDKSRKIFFFYWAFVSIGYGIVIEVYIEQILPAKAYQISQVMKWAVIGSIGLLTRVSSWMKGFYMFFYFGMVFQHIFMLSFVYKMIPEIAGNTPDEIAYKFLHLGNDDLMEVSKNANKDSLMGKTKKKNIADGYIGDDEEAYQYFKEDVKI